MTTTNQRLDYLKDYSDEIVKRFPCSLKRYEALMIAIELQKIEHLDNIDTRLISITGILEDMTSEINNICSSIDCNTLDVTNSLNEIANSINNIKTN